MSLIICCGSVSRKEMSGNIGKSLIYADPQQIINDIINTYSLVSGRTLADGDPVRLFLLSIAYRLVQERLRTENRLMQQLLYYATGDALDHLGAFRITPRNPASASVTTVRFTLSAIRPNAVLIPVGTRVTADNILYFATTKNVDIPAGSMYADVEVEAQVKGSDGNGILIGDISTLVDPIPYIQSVENITTTSGGDDIEEDDPYRERIYYAPAAFSVAGPVDAYKTLAKSVSTLIIDIAAYSPTPGVAEIRPLMEGGDLPTQTILDLIKEKLSADTVRPLTDSVVVLAPDVTTYDVNFTYYISRSKQALAADIQAAVMKATSDYNLWQRSALGRDINPDQLTTRIIEAGAKRLVITAPLFKALEEGQVAHYNTVSVTYGGLEND